jgi:hypothetical protein
MSLAHPDLREEAGGEAASEERMIQVSALWNGFYSLGATLGPLISSVLIDAAGQTASDRF